MRAPLILALLAVTAVTAVTAHAGPSGPAALPRLEVLDRGDAVEIVARGAIAADAAQVTVVRERVEIPLANRAPEARRLVEDATALLLEIRGDEPRTLSVKLRHDHARVVALAGAVTFTQDGNDLHVIIPRKPPAPPVAIAPIVAPVIAAAVAPAIAPPAAVASATVAPAAVDPAAVTPPVEDVPRALAPPPEPAPAIGGATSTRATGSRWWMILGGLVLVGGGVALAVRRRRTAAPPESQLSIIASQSLGGKSRIVWLVAGDHEIVVAISPQQIRPLARWKRTSATADRSFGRSLDEAVDDADFAPRAPAPTRALATPPEPAMNSGSRPIPPVRVGTTSPALAGLLRLRDRASTTSTPAPADGEDLDDEGGWRRELFTATGGRR